MKRTIITTGLLVAGMMFGQTVMAQTCPAEPDAWTNKREDVEGMLTIAAPGLAGTGCAMEVSMTADSSQRARVQDRSPVSERSFRGRFWIDVPAALVGMMATNTRVKVYNAQCTTASCPSTGMVQMRLEGDGAGGAKLRSWTARKAAGQTQFGRERFDIPLTAGSNIVEFQLVLGSSDGSGDGLFRVWVNNCTEASPDFEFTGLDNGLYDGISQANLGGISATNAWASNLAGQVVTFDEYESRRQTFIGGCTP